jgi:hypothetical protein
MLGGELADQTPPAGAERDADGHLPLPSQGAAEQQVGDVGAGDEQQEAAGAQQQQQRLPDAPNRDVPQRHRPGAHAFVSERVLPGQRPGDAGDVLPRLGEGNARPQAPDGRVVAHPTGVAIGERPDRGPGLGPGGEPEGGGHDSDDAAGAAFEPDVPAEDAGIGGEALRPQALAEQDHARRPGPVVLRQQPAAEARVDSQQREEVRGRERGLRGLGAAGGADVGLEVRVEESQVNEAPAALAPVQVIGVTDPDFGCAAQRLELDQAIRGGEGKGAEEEGIDDAEDRRVDADPGGQHDDDQQAGARTLAHQAQPEAKISVARKHGGLPHHGPVGQAHPTRSVLSRL